MVRPLEGSAANVRNIAYAAQLHPDGTIDFATLSRTGIEEFYMMSKKSPGGFAHGKVKFKKKTADVMSLPRNPTISAPDFTIPSSCI